MRGERKEFFMTEFAERINEILDDKGLKRADLVRELEIPEATVRSWFNRGSLPSVDLGFKVAKFLGVSIAYLLTGEKDVDSSKPQEDELSRKFSKLLPEQKKAVETVIDSFLEDGEAAETTA